MNELTTLPEVVKLKEFLVKRHDTAVEELSFITEIKDDEQYVDAEATLATVKQLYDMMSARRKQFTDPIKKAIEEIMSYENAINYTAKTDNHYNRAKAVLEAYNQAKINAKKVAEHEAFLRAEQIKYKAEYKAQVQTQLSDMLDGLHRTVVHSMAKWEGELTLANIDAKEATLKASKPALAVDKYDACFRRWGNRPDVMAPSQEDEYLVELKKELSYQDYNERFQKIVAPIKNEYLAKIPKIKENLERVAAAAKEEQDKMLRHLAEERERQKNEALQKAEEAKKKEEQAIADQKDINKMEGDFVEQSMTADLEAGPSKKVASFTDDKMWLSPFLKVVSKCATSPKFKGIVKEKGYVPEVQKWLDFYGQNVGEALEGITFTDKAKTIIRK